MTAKYDLPLRRTLPSAGRICFCALGLYCLFLWLRNPTVAADGMRNGLLICARTVLPALFPTLVLCELLFCSGLLSTPLGRLARPLGRLFGLGERGAGAVLAGWLCGTPVGARTACAAFDQGRMDARECLRVCALSATPSLPFLLGVAAPALAADGSMALCLPLAVFGSAWSLGLLWRLFFPLPQREKRAVCAAPSTPSVAILFSRSVRSATESILLICAYVVFFATLGNTLDGILASLGCSQTVRVLLTCPLELSTGVLRAATLPHRALAAPLTAACAAWLGGSIHCQLLSLIEHRPLPFAPYLLAKCVQAILAALWMVALEGLL